MNGPLLISLLPPEQIGKAAKAPPDQVSYVVAIVLLGRIGDEITVKRQDIGGLLKSPQRGSPIYRVDGMKPEEERGDDPEVAPASPERPEWWTAPGNRPPGPPP